jgi:hypothetical protein
MNRSIASALPVLALGLLGLLPAAVASAAIVDADGDGIEDAIDLDPLFSNDFSTFDTSGSITDRGGWFVRAQTTSVPKTVFVAITGQGAGTARIATCPNSGAEEISLDVESEAAVFHCIESGGTQVEPGSVIAHPEVELRKPPTGQPGSATLVLLGNGQAASLGSPVTAHPSNLGAIRVTLVDRFNAAFGSFELDAGESVDVQYLTPASVQIRVVSGEVRVSVEGQTADMKTDMTQTFSFPRAVLRTMFEEISGFLAAGAIRNAGIANSLKASVNRASTLMGDNDTAVREILESLQAKLTTFANEGQIDVAVRDALMAESDALLLLLP